AWHLRDLRTPATIASLGAMLDAERVEAVVSHNLKGLGLRCLHAVRERGLPHVHVLHDLQLSVASGVMWLRPRLDANPVFRRWYEAHTRQLLGSPRAVVSPSRYLLDEHLARGFFPTSRTVVLRNPVDPVPVTAPVTPAGPPRFAFVGQLAEHKGVRQLLRAWAAKPAPGAELHVAGDGPLAGLVAEAARRDPTLVVHGRLGADELQKLLARTDAVVVPSIWHENAPVAILEALTAGCAVLASRVGGVVEMVTDPCGILVPPARPDALAEGLARIAADVGTWRSRRAAIAAQRHGTTSAEYAEALLSLLGCVPAPAS